MSQVQNATPEKKARTEDKQNCLAVTVRIISDALAQRADGSSEVQIHGIEVANVVLVGVVEKLVEQATSVEFTLNDGSGRIKVRHYGQLASGGIKAGEYVSLVGGIRTAPSPHVSTLNIRPVQGADEVSYHMIEVVHSAMKLRRKDANSGTPAPKVKPEVETTPFKATAAEPVAAPPSTSVAMDTQVSTGPVGATPLKGEAALKEALLETLQSKASGDSGVSITTILAELGPRTSGGESEVKGALQRLIEDGEAFTTIDDDHFSAI